MGMNLMQLFGMMKSSGNPISVLEQMLGQNAGNPQAGLAMKLIGGKGPDQLKQIAENLAKERGVDLNGLAAGMGIRLPR